MLLRSQKDSSYLCILQPTYMTNAAGKPGAAAKAQPSVKSNTASQPTVKPLSLNETIARWRGLSDGQCISKLTRLLQQKAVDLHGKAKPELSESTIIEYNAQMKLVQDRLSEQHTGQPRHALPAFIEVVLRPNGPKFLQQVLVDAAETRRVAICMASVVCRCFCNLEQGDRERSMTAWRALLSEARKQYILARDMHGGFGGYCDPESLLTSQEISKGLASLPTGSADKAILTVLQYLVPMFPGPYKVQAPLLNLGHVRIFAEGTPPTVEDWAKKVSSDTDQETGLLIVVDNTPAKIYLLFDNKADGPVAACFTLPAALVTELHDYLARMPYGQLWLFPKVKGMVRLSSKPYSGVIGRESFGARINRILARVYGTDDAEDIVTQTTFRLSIVKAQSLPSACK